MIRSSDISLHCLDASDLHPAIIGEAAEFLAERTEEGIDPLWSPRSLRWKLGRSRRDGVLAWAADGGRVVATLTLARRRAWHLGEIVEVAEVCDGYTMPAYQGHGLFSELVALSMRRMAALGISLFYGTPNESSRSPLAERLGFVEHRARICHFERPAAGPLEAPEYEFAEPDRVPGDDVLAALAERQRAAGFSIVRDGAFLRQRFAANPLAAYRLFSVSSGGVPCGLAVHRSHVVSPGRRDLCLADWLLDDVDVLSGIAAHALAEAQAGGCDLATAWAPEGTAEAEALLGAGFEAVWTSALLFSPGERGRRIARGEEPLVFTIASSDNV